MYKERGSVPVGVLKLTNLKVAILQSLFRREETPRDSFAHMLTCEQTRIAVAIKGPGIGSTTAASSPKLSLNPSVPNQ